MPTKDDLKNADLVTFSVGSSKYLMAPTHGFRLMRWTIQTITDEREILHWPENTCDKPLAFVRGGNPLLFPFAGRSFDRGVENAWRSPGGDRLSMPIHGFARESQFLERAVV
jgi:D-hexose-6-phosphate mutarotase